MRQESNGAQWIGRPRLENAALQHLQALDAGAERSTAQLVAALGAVRWQVVAAMTGLQIAGKVATRSDDEGTLQWRLERRT